MYTVLCIQFFKIDYIQSSKTEKKMCLSSDYKKQTKRQKGM